MDISTIATPVISAILSIAAVSAFVSKYVKYAVKYVRLAADAINTLDTLIESLDDGQLTGQEIDAIKAKVLKFKADLKA